MDLNSNIIACGSTSGDTTGCVRLFGGYTDPLILSRYPIIQSSYLKFQESPFTETTVLYSRIQAPQGPVNVFCTHLLPANFPLIGSTFEDTNRQQTQEMLNYINSTVQNSTEPIIAMGDFNFGPSSSNSIESSWQNNYILFPNQGYRNALIVTNAQPPCTYCSSNALVSHSPNQIIDHIFVKNAGVISAGVFATANVVQVNNRLVPLSDHYGVAASLCVTGNFTNPSVVTGGTTNTVIVVTGLNRPIVSGGSALVVSSLFILLAAFMCFF